MIATKGSTYTPMPEVPESARERYQLMLEVLSGKTTVTAAAKRLGLSRNRFQSLMHRSLQSMLEAVSPQAPGRPATSETERELRQENERLKRQVERLENRVNTIDRLLIVASDMLQGRVQPARARRKRTTKAASPKNEEGSDEDPERRLEAALVMRSCGLRARLCAAIVGIGASTLRRWSARAHAGQPLRSTREHRKEPNPAIAARVREVVRDLKRLAGADVLRHIVPGVSRRQAAALKRETLTSMERERIAAAERVRVHVTGSIRGFDAMHVLTTGGWRFLLVAGDATVPFRTSIRVAERYNSAAVAAALEHDFIEHGPPLVLRLDRAKCHQTDEVKELLDAWRVLPLHGPAHHPGFYGQLERQNREHRAWLDCLGMCTPDRLEHEVGRMRAALNDLYKRPTLGFRTAEEMWNKRRVLAEDRDELRNDVDTYVAQLARIERSDPMPRDVAERVAIERALIERNYLSRNRGGWC